MVFFTLLMDFNVVWERRNYENIVPVLVLQESLTKL